MRTSWIAILLCFLLSGMTVNASGAKTAEELSPKEVVEQDIDFSMLEEVDFSELDRFLTEQQNIEGFQFKEIVKKIINGEEVDKKWLFSTIKNTLMQEIVQSKGYILQIILLVSAFALLYQFANVFENAAVTDISFYMVYMILMALLMKSFMVMSELLSLSLNRMLDFMHVLLPAFCATVLISTGTITAMGIYELTLLVIYVIEAVLLYIIVPAVHIYVMLELLNHLTKEELISKLTGLVKSAVEWSLKFLFTLVVGINVVQGLLTPVIDGFKTSMFAKTASMLPGVGNSVNAVTEIMLGSGIVIKNGVGIAGIIVILILCIGPMIKVGLLAFSYKLAAAFVQPIADKRLSGCISGMGEGARLMSKTMMTANAMLMVTIALVIASTTWNR